MSVHKMTLASAWETLTQSPITDDFLDWPADLFALTEVILERSEAYQFVLSPQNGFHWPPRRFGDWSEVGEQAGRQWAAWAEDRDRPFPDRLADEWKVFRQRTEMPLERWSIGNNKNFVCHFVCQIAVDV